MTDESSFDTVSILTTVEEDIREVETSEGEEKLPKGATYPLNSKRLIVGQLRRLTAMLELLSSLLSEGTSGTLRQLIEGKLIELGHEPKNVQVIVTSVNSKLYLVDKSGIIKQESEHVSLENVSTHYNISNVTNEIDTLRGALQEACLGKVEGLRERVHERDKTLCAELETANTG